MKRWMNRISTFFLFGFSVLILSLSLILKVGSFKNPGAGFAPFLASLLLLCLSAVILIKEFFGFEEGGEKVPFITRKNLIKPINLMIALIGYGLLFTALGYVISTFLLMLAMLVIYEPKRWGHNIITALIIVGMSFLVFAVWLRVPLPKGIFDLSSFIRSWW
jgi:putative tricarboxylic transport membrane protein